MMPFPPSVAASVKKRSFSPMGIAIANPPLYRQISRRLNRSWPSTNTQRSAYTAAPVAEKGSVLPAVAENATACSRGLLAGSPPG